jgi:LysM repeat protein
VAPGETLGDVAVRYAVGVDDIRRRNRLGDQSLAIGSILEIPVAGT